MLNFSVRAMGCPFRTNQPNAPMFGFQASTRGLGKSPLIVIEGAVALVAAAATAAPGLVGCGLGTEVGPAPAVGPFFEVVPCIVFDAVFEATFDLFAGAVIDSGTVVAGGPPKLHAEAMSL